MPKNRVVILTALAVEYRAVCEHLTNLREVTHKGTVYEKGEFAAGGGTWDVLVAEVGAGNDSAAMEAERAITYFNPQVVLFVGVAGGIKDVDIGDVVAAAKIYGYEYGKAEKKFKPRPDVGNTTYDLIQRARSVARKDEWRRRIQSPGPPPPRAWVGAIAAGEKVISATESRVFKFIKDNYGDALAVEMEGRGFLEATHANKHVLALVVRGISDLINNKSDAHDPERQVSASRHASAFTFEVLSKLDLQSGGEEADVKDGDGHPPPVGALQGAAPEAENRQRHPRANNLRTATIGNVNSVLIGQPSPVLLAGGGGSAMSGIPLSEDLVKRAAKWQYCIDKGLNYNDPRIKPSDWLGWLKEESTSWGIRGSLFEDFPSVLKNLMRTREGRRDFLLTVTRPNVPASLGYQRLVDFLARRLLTTVLQANFDSVFRDLCRSSSRLHHIDVVEHPAAYRQIKTSVSHPLLVYLYGSLDYYLDKIDKDPSDWLDSELITRLVPVLRDHPLIVIGYRGAEASIMRRLLIDNLEAADHYPYGIYWCVRNYRGPDVLHPLVRELSSLAKDSFQVVPIDGFDEIMERLFELHQSRPRVVSVSNPQTEHPPEEVPTFDMQPVEADFDKELEWVSLRSRLIRYCQEMEISVPDRPGREWIVRQLCDLDLAVTSGGHIKPTLAGYLLFGLQPHERLPSAKVRLRVLNNDGATEEWVEGNLWNQLAEVTNVLTDFNKPFRLKGEKSENVFPYPPLALKEVLVNALVHRQYDVSQHVVIEIHPDRIRVANPGGLVEEVIRQVAGASIINQIEQGKKGIKGYRNPVIADLFYSSGDMDKKGSGLADVLQLVKDNGGKVTFGPVEANTAFEVIIWSRPEAVDQQTGTAKTVISTRYAANILEVAELPSRIWHAPTEYSWAKEVWGATDAAWLPPFITHEQRIHTFSNLGDKENPLREVVDSSAVGSVSIDEFCARYGGERPLVWLMNECLYQHLKHCGLTVDYARKRAYFPRTDTGNRSIAYQARLRRSTRTVSKQILSPLTQKVRYWEHQAVSFSYEHFGDTWGLQLLPGYVFTRDGYRDLLRGDRVNILSTKRASRDYNSKVHVDLVFWAWVLSEGQNGLFGLRMGPTRNQVEKAAKAPSLRGGRSEGRKRSASKKPPAWATLKMPPFLINSVLPTFTIHSLVESLDEWSEELGREELSEIEEELSALAEEFEEQFEE